jgi:hypothetical protein
MNLKRVKKLVHCYGDSESEYEPYSTHSELRTLSIILLSALEIYIYKNEIHSNYF